MQFRLQITYFDKDDKTVNLILKKEELPDFFRKLKEKEPYLNENTNVGFWTGMENIRHIIITPQREENIAKEIEESSEDSESVQNGNENTE
jgi:hypothetical protein